MLKWVLFINKISFFYQFSAVFPNFKDIWPNNSKIIINRLFLPDILDISSFNYIITKKIFWPLIRKISQIPPTPLFKCGFNKII